MGQTVKNLSKRKISNKAIFPHRFVNEICENMHFHYKNLRLILTMSDWLELARGFKDSLERWEKRGRPMPSKKTHIELCRKKVVNEDESQDILVNLNKNLYRLNKGKIFGEGAELDDPTYIHLKVRDIRLELSINDFKVFADAVNEAKERLEGSSNASDLQEG